MKSSANIVEYLGLKGFTQIGLGAIGLVAAMTANPSDVLGEPVEPKCWKLVQFDDLVQMIRNNCIQLFDVRDREEVAETGLMPQAVNIPLSELDSALKLSSAEFGQKYGTAAPSCKDLNIVTSCKSGKRSKAAMEIFHRNGYKFARTYAGSFTEYSAKAAYIQVLPDRINFEEPVNDNQEESEGNNSQEDVDDIGDSPTENDGQEDAGDVADEETNGNGDERWADAEAVY